MSTPEFIIDAPSPKNGLPVTRLKNSMEHQISKLPLKPSVHISQDDEEEESKDDAILPPTRKVSRQTTQVALRERTVKPRRSPAEETASEMIENSQENSDFAAESVPADSVVLAPDIAEKLISLLSRRENLASGTTSLDAQNSKSELKGRPSVQGVKLCPTCRASDKSQDNATGSEQVIEDSSDED
ncbi:hypothetical protein V5799_003690 [Amblyomma americanum]|uniref:Uncharacterized protein n=1 Tax=Amblyomma americanum TaxID=6943 RepID=A0AAQ4D888_AMBAM